VTPSLLLAMWGLESWLVSQGLMLAGAAAITVPIIIHLLHRRKFQIVEWAAMDFLLEADRKNRRRIQLEDFLLLLLRCLAVFLAGLLLARPFLPSSLTGGLLQGNQVERILVVDDSLSLQWEEESGTVWEETRKGLADFVRALASERGAENSLTLLLTSRPKKPLFSATPVRKENLEEVVREIEHLSPSDQPAEWDSTLTELEGYLAAEVASTTRTISLFSDLRKVDWQPQGDAQSQLSRLKNIAKQASSLQVIDVLQKDAASQVENVAITSLTPVGVVVQQVPVRMDVEVTNFGASTASDLRIRLTVGEGVPLTAEVEELAAGEKRLVPFEVLLQSSPDAPIATEAGTSETSASSIWQKVKAEVVRRDGSRLDRLPADDSRCYAANPAVGVPVLIVDGDPSTTFGKSESFYLERSLRPRGPIPSGVIVDVATEGELGAVLWEKYQVVFFCNVAGLGEVPAITRKRLEDWTAAGGGLVLFPGDQNEPGYFNRWLYDDGKGLAPFAIDAIVGDESEKSWSQMQLRESQHPVFEVFTGQNNPFLENIKVFRHWSVRPPVSAPAEQVTAAWLVKDGEAVPAFVERRFGQGRVLAATFPADADWTNWTSDPSFPITMQEIVRYFSALQSPRESLLAGQPLVQPLDITQYLPAAELLDPAGRRHPLQARPAEADTDSASAAAKPAGDTPVPTTNVAASGRWTLRHNSLPARGFYDLLLQSRESGTSTKALLAVNIPSAEGNVQRIETAQFDKGLAEFGARRISLAELAGGLPSSSLAELARYILPLLLLILAFEQILGWYLNWSRR